MLACTGALLLLAQIALCKQPNIIFILTDDQDLHMESVEHMPYLKSLIIDKGTTYDQHYCTVALCCPSRATLWTGMAAHNHNITSVAPPTGGYPKVVSQGINDENLFLWMQDAGYNTYYTGKLWNFHTVDNYNKPYAKGFNGSDFLLDPYTYQYWNGIMSHNNEKPVSIKGQYTTDVLAQRTVSWLEKALKEDRPFFLTASPIAPHSNWVIDEEKDLSYLDEPRPAPRHEHLFKDYKIARDPSYNRPINGAPSWVKTLQPLNSTKIEYYDHYQRQRLRSLQSVDEIIPQLVDRLEAAGELDNTYIFYTTDNGYHIAQHRMDPGKSCGYDTDIHIPFFVRGPGIPAGGSADMVTSHTDVAATILKIAGVDKMTDGEIIPMVVSESDKKLARHEHAAVEFWGLTVPEGIYGAMGTKDREAGAWTGRHRNNTYRGLRLVSPNYSLYYSVWCTGELELYDLVSDPYQMNNLAAAAYTTCVNYTISGRPMAEILSRLNGLIMVLKTCKDQQCTRPWDTLHPDGSVTNLLEALEQKYDSFYKEQPKMWYSECRPAYILDLENQEPVKPFGGDSTPEKREFNWDRHWQHFT